MRRFAVVACRNLANTTQPFSGRDKETSLRGRVLGEKAVEVDINKVFYTPQSEGYPAALTEIAEKSYRYRALKSKRKFGASRFNAEKATQAFNARVRGYISANNTRALKKLAKDFNWQGVVDHPDPAIHKAARSGPRMKVKKQRGNMHLILGGRKGALETYINKVKKRVGLAKAGWAKCADLIPTSTKGAATRGIPQWVTRNKAKAPGAIQDLSRDERNPKVIMSNKIPWTSAVLSPNEAVKALRLAKANWVEYLNKSMRGELRRQAKLASG